MLLVVGEVKRDEEDLGGHNSLWLFRTMGNQRWGLAWYHHVGDFAIFGGLKAFWQPGDERKQIAVYVGGVDWQGLAVYGFRKKGMEPVRLALIGHLETHCCLRRRGGAVGLVERAKLVDLIRRRHIHLPVSSAWQGHVLAVRHYAYDARSGIYRLVRDWVPDQVLEGQLPRRIRRELSQEVMSLVRRPLHLKFP